MGETWEKGNSVSASDAPRWHRALDILAETLDQRGERGWIVGGCLRDALLRRPMRDVDIVLTCDPLDIARTLPRNVVASLAPLNRDSVRAGLRPDGMGEPLPIDFSPLRPPAHASEGSAAATTWLPAIEANLVQRDFRVNAMALPLAARREFAALLTAGVPSLIPGDVLPAPATLIDPVDGYADLQAGILRLTSSHSFDDEPGRIVRAARLAASHSFTLAPDLIQHARSAAHRLIAVSGDRLRDEMARLLTLSRAAEGVAALAEMEALHILLPGLNAPEKVTHALAGVRAAACLQADGEPPDAAMAPLASLDALRAWYAAPLRPDVPRIVALRWALLAHAILPESDRGGLPAGDASHQAQSQLLAPIMRVPLANAEQTIVTTAAMACAVWRERLADAMPPDAALRHLFAAHGPAGVDMLAAAAACNAALSAAPLSGARVSSQVPERVRAILDIYFTDRERLHPLPLLTGADLIAELGLRPGPALGDVLRHIHSAQIEGVITTRVEALALAKHLTSAPDA